MSVNRRDVSSQQMRIQETGIEHQRSHPNPLGGIRGRDQRRERRGHPQVIGGERDVVAVSLRTPALLDELIARTDAQHREAEPERSAHLNFSCQVQTYTKVSVLL